MLGTSMSLQQYAEQQINLYLLAPALLIATAAVLIWRKSNDRAAVVGAFVLVSFATGGMAQAYAQAVPALDLAARIIEIVPIAGLLPFFCIIPDGRFRPGWLRWAAVAAVPVSALAAYDVLDPPVQIAFGGMLGVLIAGSMVHRYRSLPASPQQEQVAWALAAFALLVAAQCLGRPLRPLPLPSMPLNMVQPRDVWFLLLMGTLLMVGALACLAVALLNDELFRVEIIVNRALVYSVLTLLVVGVYVLVVGYLSFVFQSSGNVWFSLVATGLAAALFQPVRQRVQRLVNQLIYGERDDPYHVIAHLGQRLGAALEPSAALATITHTVRESLKLPYVAIALEHGGASEIAAASGTPLMEPISFPLVYQGAPVGQLLVTPRPGDKDLAPADRTLLADLAQQASISVYGVRLLAELKQMAADLQHSREQLVLAREEERRRLRRDLHDDLAPTLAGLSLTASTITDLLPGDPTKATVLANHLHAEMRDAVGYIRRLVYDLRPPALDELGLVSAIRERAAQFSERGADGEYQSYDADSLRVVLDAPDALPLLPAAVEVAAYRIVQEALMNVARHACARTCHIVITFTADELYVEIKDDGVGIPSVPLQGIGLHSMQERAAELGGKFEIESALAGGKGTRILVRLPIKNIKEANLDIEATHNS